MEKLVVRNGAVELLINIASTEYWPPTLREAAAGHLMSLAEEWANIEHVDGTKPLQVRTPLPGRCKLTVARPLALSLL